jgi:hypothetical protein
MAMAANISITIRRARREDVDIIVRMLADDPLGGARERLEDPLPPSYFRAFERIDRDQNIQLMVAEDNDGAVIGCLQLCILPGTAHEKLFDRPGRQRVCRAGWRKKCFENRQPAKGRKNRHRCGGAAGFAAVPGIVSGSPGGAIKVP